MEVLLTRKEASHVLDIQREVLERMEKRREVPELKAECFHILQEPLI